MNAVEKYREMAEVHAAIDYGDKTSVNRANRAADSLRSIGQIDLDSGQLMSILSADHPSSIWAAHHLLEFHELTADQRRLAIQRIEIEIAKGGVTAMGERIFLTQLEKIRDKPQHPTT